MKPCGICHSESPGGFEKCFFLQDYGRSQYFRIPEDMPAVEKSRQSVTT